MYRTDMGRKPRMMLEYWPPHPSRGTGYHRIVFVLLKSPIREHLGRQDHKGYLKNPQNILGYSFFRTCWTRSVLGILSKHKGKWIHQDYRNEGYTVGRGDGTDTLGCQSQTHPKASKPG